MFIIWKSIISHKVTGNKHQISPLIDNLEKPACASKRDKLVLANLRYMYTFLINFQFLKLQLSVSPNVHAVHSIIRNMDGPRITQILGLEKNCVMQNSRKWDYSN